MNNNYQDRFYPSALKKQRITAAKLDIQHLYTLMLKMQKNYHDIKIIEFKQVWIQSQFIYVHWCIAEEEDSEEFYQCLYQIFINNYYYESDLGKTFTLYSLYFLYYGSQEKIKISVDPAFVDSLDAFVNTSKILANIDMLFVVKKLFTAFNFCTKLGLKTILLKSNGESLKKYNPPQLQVQHYPPMDMCFDMVGLRETSMKYEKLKKKNKKLEKEEELQLKYSDNKAIQRIETLLRDLKQESQ